MEIGFFVFQICWCFEWYDYNISFSSCFIVFYYYIGINKNCKFINNFKGNENMLIILLIEQFIQDEWFFFRELMKFNN